MRCVIVSLIAITFAQTCNAAIDWPAFLSRQDEVWTTLPSQWGDGVLLGNGILGANVFSPDKGTTLHWRIGRTDVSFHGNRLPIGDLVLHPVGKITGANLRLDLWNAEMLGTLHTTAGDIRLRSFTHADKILQVIELDPDPGEAKCTMQFEPGKPINPRLLFRKDPVPDTEKNPLARYFDASLVHGCTQPLLDGNEFSTAFTEQPPFEAKRTVLLSVGLGKAGTTQKQATDALSAAPVDVLRKSHQAWWHDYWPQSFVSIPDDRLQSFYDIQMYKLASATRGDRPAIDLAGPWTAPTPWPRIWWNLNLQLTYWPAYTANRLDVAQSLSSLVFDHADALAKNAGAFSADSSFVGRSTGYDCATAPNNGQEICNLPWVCHNLWLQYRCTMDDAMLRDHLFPLLERATNYYLHELKADASGTLHIAAGYSPEYPDQPTPNPDCNIDLALLRWGCQTLIDANDRLKLNDPLRPKWVETLARLTPYPVDVNGLRISASMSFAVSHRHFSHLLMVYPLYLMTPDKPEDRTLIEKSLAHWMSMPKALQGYSFTGASSINSMLGHGDDALTYLNKLLDKRIEPNTLYHESGPVIETPLAAAASLNDMLLSDWGGRLHVMPAIPKTWPDVSFKDLRGGGGFLVSAVRRGGRTRFIRVVSAAGEPCVIQTDAPGLKADLAGCEEVEPGRYVLKLVKGQAATLTDGTVDGVTEPVQPIDPRPNFYGLKAKRL